MYCPSCGYEVKDGDAFCGNCGARVQAGPGAVQDASVTYPKTGPGTVQEPVPLAEEPSAGSNAPAKKSRFPVIVAGIVGLAVVSGALFFALQGGWSSGQATPQPISDGVQSSSSDDAQSSSSDEPPASASSEESQPALSPEEGALKALDGWWAGWYHRPGYYAAYGNIHDSAIDWYYYNPDTNTVEYASTVDIVKVERFDEGGAKGWRFVPSTATNGSFAYYQAEGDEDSLPIYKTDFGYGIVDAEHNNTDAVERFGITRISDLDALDSDGIHSKVGFEQAQALAKERGEEESDSTAATAKASFDQKKAEAEARLEAEAAGKQIFTGRVVIEDENTRAQELGIGATPTAGMNPTYAFLQLSAPTTVTAQNADGATYLQEPYRTREGVESVLLGTNSSYSATCAPWEKYDGQEITIACSQDEMRWFSDSVGILFNVNASHAEVIAPLTEEDAKAKDAVASPDAYVLADSATKAYSRAELEALDNHTLFLARNEIYARHGRGFKNQELRDYFAGKAWYKETASPEAFNENVLSETEKANANLMLEIEKSRNSPYLN